MKGVSPPSCDFLYVYFSLPLWILVFPMPVNVDGRSFQYKNLLLAIKNNGCLKFFSLANAKMNMKGETQLWQMKLYS